MADREDLFTLKHGMIFGGERTAAAVYNNNKSTNKREDKSRKIKNGKGACGGGGRR